MTLEDALNWRYATKRMTGENVPEENVDRTLEAARLAPSSFGLQPYTLLVALLGDQRHHLLDLGLGDRAPGGENDRCEHSVICGWFIATGAMRWRSSSGSATSRV